MSEMVPKSMTVISNCLDFFYSIISLRIVHISATIQGTKRGATC